MVRVAVLSDWHLDVNEPSGPILQALREAFAASAADWLVCAGDFGGSSSVASLVVPLFQGRCLWVPGNHDVIATEGRDSWGELRQLERVPGNLMVGPRELGDGWVAAGTLGWYDYSFGGADLSSEEYARVKPEVWLDGTAVHWNLPDERVCRRFVRRFRQQLREVCASKILAVTHTLPFRECVQEKASDRLWQTRNAYMGAAAVGALLEEHQVRHVVFGHSHLRMSGTSRAGIPFHCAPLGYRKEWRQQAPAVEVRSAMHIIELDA